MSNRFKAILWFGAVALKPILFVQVLGRLIFLTPAPYKFSFLPLVISGLIGGALGGRILNDPRMNGGKAFWLGSLVALYSWIVFFPLTCIWHCLEGNCGPQYSVSEEVLRALMNGIWGSVFVLPILMPIGGLGGLLLYRRKLKT